MLTVFLAAAAAAQTSLPDVGLITKLSGDVRFSNEAEKKEPAKVQAFMKVRRGDRLKLPEAGSLTLLYFASGRQESWKGPGTIIAGDTESAAAGGQQPPSPPEVKLISTKASRQMAGAPPVLTPADFGNSGVIQTMAPTCPAPEKAAAPVPRTYEAQRKIKEAEKLYQELKKGAAADDVTPELYLFGVLAEYKQFPEMVKMIDAMLEKRPGDAALKNLKASVRAQATGGK
jgi:hypothetical protein